jgi:dienelactone hydrolase
MVTTYGHIEAATFRIPAGHAWVDGDLLIPDTPKGLVIFANGSGATRHHPREQAMAETMNDAGYGSLLLDLLTPHEGAMDETTGESGFGIPALAERLTQVTEWLAWNRDTSSMKLAFIGAGAAASAAALIAAADLPTLVQAVVCQGGRPDHSGRALSRVKAPTLLIVGGLDDTVADFNRAALEEMTCEKSMEIIHGSDNHFEHPGETEEAMRLTRLWFDRTLAG